MATSSILGGDPVPVHSSGKDARSLGPSDSSDSGSDALGELGFEELGSDSDATGTGERASVGRTAAASGADILPDRVVRVAGDDALDGETVSLDQPAIGVDQLAADDSVEPEDDEDFGELDETEAGSNAPR